MIIIANYWDVSGLIAINSVNSPCIVPGEFSNTSINTSIIFTSNLKPMVLMDIKVRNDNYYSGTEKQLYYHNFYFVNIVAITNL